MEAGIGTSSELNSSMELEQVFWHFFVKFQHLNAPRSVSEARITRDEVVFLEHWFSIQFGKPRNWCDRTWQEKVEGDVTASSREMFGVLFLILAAETCRDRCSEDLVWPTIAASFLPNKTTHSVLFANQQPTEICKIAMVAGARKLALRNLIDRCGKQEYFDTLKLQIGFTVQGAIRRMPEWLDGLGCTTAVKLLNGAESDPAMLGLVSASFQNLWQTLRDFRASRISESSARAFLQSSPWARAHWIPQLLEAATLRRAPRGLSPAEVADERIPEALCEAILQWSPPAKPSLLLRLNEQRICDLLAGRETAIFAIDGVVVGRWTAESGGGFRGNRQLECQKPGDTPNLRPRRLTISSNGEPIEEVDFADIGLAESIVLFDMATGCKGDSTGTLDQNRDYALLCDTDMTAPGLHAWKTKNRHAFLLLRPLTADTKLLCDADLCWQPQLLDRKPRRTIRLSIESASGKSTVLGTDAQLVIKGVPEDAKEVTLLLGDSTNFLVLGDAGWCTTTAVRIGIQTVIGEERTRVRIKGSGYIQTVVPKLSLLLSGVAVRRSELGRAGDTKWHLLGTQESINRADGDGKARVFDSGDFGLYEGPCLVEGGRSSTIELRDLQGWGNPLLRSSEGSDGKILVAAVEDRGSVDLFIPALFGKVLNKVYLRAPRPTAEGHTVWVWTDIDTPPSAIGGKDIRVEGDGFIWELPRIPSVFLMGVSYEGTCLGASWNLAHVVETLRRPLSAKTVAIMRWLKVPLLSGDFNGLLKRAVARNPAEFLRGWLDGESLMKPFSHRPAEQGLDTVVRSLFWNFSERHSGRLNELVQALGSRLPPVLSPNPVENFKKTLLFLGEVCPSFAYSLARAEGHNEKYRASVRSAVQEILRHSTDNIDDLRRILQLAASNCARLCDRAPQDLAKMVKLYESDLFGEGESYPPEMALRRLGESGRGREYLVAALLLECLERTR